MVTTSGFTHTPLTRLLILTLILTSITTSILDIKHLLPIKYTPHLWPYLQFSRVLTYQFAYTSATELLISVVLLYQFRVLERVWGTRKYTSFVVVVVGVDMMVVPLVGMVLKMGTWGGYNYVPSGVVGLVFAALSVWREEVPRVYRYKVVTTSQDGDGREEGKGVVLSDKSTTYLMAVQLALSQFPYQVMPALVGWVVGSAWVGELLPGGVSRWRVPRWVVGESKASKERGQYEGLRRRLEEEGSAADGMRNVSDQQATRQEERRGFMGQIAGYFTGS